MSTGKYTRVGAVKGPLTIGGAVKRIQEDPEFTYVPQFGVAGSLAEVKEWLQENQPDDAVKALAGAYNAKTLKKAAVLKAFQAEVEEWKTDRAERMKRRQQERDINLMILVELLKKYNEQKKDKALDMGSESKRTRRSARDKLTDTISAGKVLDVSSVKSTKVTLKSNSTKKRLSDDESDPLYHVVYNPASKNVADGIRKFLTGYGGFTEEQIVAAVESATGGSDTSLSTLTVTERPSSPLTKRFTSPVRRAAENSVDDLLGSLEGL